MNKIFFPARARTGTTSLWTALSKHPDICASIQKEPLRHMLGADLGPKNLQIVSEEFPFYKYYSPYQYSQFFRKKNYKVLFDGTPIGGYIRSNLHSKILNDLLKKNEKFIKELKCIYILREPWDLLHSAFRLIIRTRIIIPLKEGIFFIDGKLHEETAMRYINILIDEPYWIDHINKFFGKENILFVPLSNIQNNLKRILDFMEVDSSIEIKIENLNQNLRLFKGLTGPELIQAYKALAVFNRVVDKNRKEIDDKIKSNTEKINKMGLFYE